MERKKMIKFPKRIDDIPFEEKTPEEFMELLERPDFWTIDRYLKTWDMKEGEVGLIFDGKIPENDDDEWVFIPLTRIIIKEK